jgi:hypothetical protein
MSRVAAMILPPVVLAQVNPPAPPDTGPGWGWAIILAALAVFLVAIFGGIQSWRRRPSR